MDGYMVLNEEMTVFPHSWSYIFMPVTTSSHSRPCITVIHPLNRHDSISMHHLHSFNG